MLNRVVQCPPVPGQCYCDHQGRSFIVHSLAQQRVLIEYANGELHSISLEQWQNLHPIPSLF